MIESAPSVRPWKDCVVETNLVRPVARCASFSAPSIASAPRAHEEGARQLGRRDAAQPLAAGRAAAACRRDWWSASGGRPARRSPRPARVAVADRAHAPAAGQIDVARARRRRARASRGPRRSRPGSRFTTGRKPRASRATISSNCVAQRASSGRAESRGSPPVASRPLRWRGDESPPIAARPAAHRSRSAAGSRACASR